MRLISIGENVYECLYSLLIADFCSYQLLYEKKEQRISLASASQAFLLDPYLHSSQSDTRVYLSRQSFLLCGAMELLQKFTFSQAYYSDYSEACSPSSTPFVSAPSSPGRHCNGAFYFSAPTSPRWTDAFAVSSDNTVREYPPSIPLHWDENQGNHWHKNGYKDEADSFTVASDFEFSARFPELSNPSVSPTPMSSANELFCNGQIKPLRIPVTCIEHASSSADHNKMFDHSSDPTDIHEPISGSTRTNSLAVCSLPHTMEFHNNCKTSNSSISAPQTPRFSSRSTLNVTSSGISCQLYRGKSASSVSAPQSPNTPLHRVRGALCGVSPSKMDRAFDASFLISAKASQHNAGVSSEVEKALGMSMQMPVEAVTHPLQIQKQGRDCLRRTGRSMFSFPHRSQGTGHRRTRSFSPLRIFQRNDHSQSQMVSPLEAVEQPNIQRAQESTGGGRSDEDSNVEKGSSRKWTLKDLLHRKSTGENRSNTITATSRKSEPSANSASPTEKMVEKSLSIGRSSSESSHSSTSTLSCRKEGVPSTNLCLSRSKILESKDREPSVNLHNIKKGPRNIVLDARTQSFSSSSHHYDNGKTKSSSQKSVRTYVQRGSKWDSTLSSCETQYSTHKLYAERTAISEVDSSNTKTKSTIQRGNKQKNNKECVSPHEMHYVRHKAQTEELRKRTFLPYRQGLLGCLGFTSRSYKTVSTISKTLQSVSG